MGVMNGPAYRMVMDTGDWDTSTWVNVPGNSGHIRAPHFTDQIHTWNQGEQYPFRFHEGIGQSIFLTFVP
jgi:penicillin G amidase